MRTFTSSLVLTALLGLATTVSAKFIQWQPCEGYENTAEECIVDNVDFEPCSMNPSWTVCRVEIGKAVSFSFDFTPNFSGSDLQTSIWWKHWYGDLPMDHSWTDNSPCTSTACPVTAGVKHTYNRTFTTSPDSWPQQYRLESKLWNGENKYCCFTFTIELARWWNYP